MRQVLVVAGNHREFLHFCFEMEAQLLIKNESYKINHTEMTMTVGKTIYKYFSRPDSARAFYFDDLLRIGTWYNRPNEEIDFINEMNVRRHKRQASLDQK